MRSARRQGSHDRQRAILMAALDCFSTRGVSATTIEDIRAKSGASIGSIYHHFRSKENLAATLYVEGLREYHAGLLRALRRCRSAEYGDQGRRRISFRVDPWARELGQIPASDAGSWLHDGRGRS